MLMAMNFDSLSVVAALDCTVHQFCNHWIVGTLGAVHLTLFTVLNNIKKKAEDY